MDTSMRPMPYRICRYCHRTIIRNHNYWVLRIRNYDESVLICPTASYGSHYPTDVYYGRAPKAIRDARSYSLLNLMRRYDARG